MNEDDFAVINGLIISLKMDVVKMFEGLALLAPSDNGVLNLQRYAAHIRKRFNELQDEVTQRVINSIEAEQQDRTKKS